MNTILHERQLEGYYCTLCYAYFDFKRRTLTLANSGLPYALRSTAEGCTPIELPGIPLGTFPGTEYDQAIIEIAAGDIFVFCTDGIYETFNASDEEFGTAARGRDRPVTPRLERSLDSRRDFEAAEGFAARPHRPTT